MWRNLLLVFSLCVLIFMTSLLFPRESKADVNDYMRFYTERAKERNRQLMNQLEHDDIIARMKRIEERSREIDRVQKESAELYKRNHLMHEMGRYDSYFDKGF